MKELNREGAEKEHMESENDLKDQNKHISNPNPDKNPTEEQIEKIGNDFSEAREALHKENLIRSIILTNSIRECTIQ
jgi:hypothetical protein